MKDFCIVDKSGVVIVKNLTLFGAEHRLHDFLKHHPTASTGLTEDYSKEYSESGKVVPLSASN